MSIQELPKNDNGNIEIVIEQDGDALCAHFVEFENLQESPAGFGYTEQDAVIELMNEMKI